MYPFQPRRVFSSDILLLVVSVPRLKYSPNSFMLVSRGLTQSAIVVTVGSVFVSSPSSTWNTCGSTLDPKLRLLMKKTPLFLVFISTRYRFRCVCCSGVSANERDYIVMLHSLFVAHVCGRANGHCTI